MPVLGAVKLRRHLFGRQASFGTAVPAVRAYPFSGVPSPNLNLQEQTGDMGALYPVARRIKGAPDLNYSLSDSGLAYNDIPLILSAFFGAGVTPSGGTAKTWDYTPSAFTADDFDPFTYEFGDDADGSGGNPNDWEQYIDGVLTGFTIDTPDQGAGAATATLQWKFGDIRYAGSTDIPPSGSIPSITDRPDTQPVTLYLKDASVYVDSDASDVGSTQLLGAVHKFTLTASQEVDEKRFVDGSQSFNVQQYGRGPISINLELTYAKTADTVGVGSESDAWSADEQVDRYIRVAFESKVEADTGTPYSWEFSLPARYFERAHGEVGNNAVVVLTAEAFADSVLDGAFFSTVVNTLPSL